MQNSVSEEEGAPFPAEAGPAPGFNTDAPAFSYDEVFPALSTPTAMPPPQKAWSSKLRVGSSIVTQHFVISRAERKFDNSEKFGESESMRACTSIMQATNTNIEICAGKDQALTFLVTGKNADVIEAQRRIIANFQTPSQTTVEIPKEYHRKLLGKGGQRLRDMEKLFGCKISVPQINDPSDTITISGPRNGVEKAMHEIKVTADEFSKQAIERILVPKIFHPFICGPHNENVLKLQADLGVRINVPPPSVQKDELTITGTKEGVLAARDSIQATYNEMEKICKQVSVEVPKSQHKYIIGPKGFTLAEILQQTGVAVEMPAPDDITDTITLRGPQEKLGQALTMVCLKATSIKTSTVTAPGWLHKRLRGKKGENIRRIVGDDMRIHVEFKEDNDSIRIEGPAEEVTRVAGEFEKETADYLSKLVFEEIRVDPKYFKHIIGKQGSNVNRLKEETGAEISISEDGNTASIQIEGSKEGVAAVKADLEEMVRKLENEREVGVNVDIRIMRKMGRIRDVRDKFPTVQIVLPPTGEQGEVKLRGPNEDVAECAKELKNVARELAQEHFSEQVPVFKEFHKFVIGKGGINIRKIREETNTMIDLPSEGDSSDVIWITGREAAVKQAKERIQKIQEEMTNIVTQEITIPPKLYNQLIGSHGRLIQAISHECGGVQIKFPNQDSNSDRVTIRGPKEDVERAIQQLEDQKNEREAASFTVEIKAKPQHHKFLIGKNGSTVSKIRGSTGARIIFPRERDEDAETITIIGKKEQVEAARIELEQMIRDIGNSIEVEIEVDPEHHKHFVARRGAVIHQISDECGGVTISFPRPGAISNKVTLKGPKECIELAKQRIEEAVKDQLSMVTIECVIPKQHHRTVMGPRGSKVQCITHDFEVQVKFPERPQHNPDDNGEESAVNGESESGEPSLGDIIRITGKPEKCQAAKEALLALVPVTIEVPVPYELHRSIIGRGGDGVRALMDEHDVRIVMSSQSDQEDVVRVLGAPACVEKARLALLERVTELEKDKEDRVLRSYSVSLEIDPEYHPKIIGRGGKVISKIRDDFGVVVNLPKRGTEGDNVITIQGYEDKALLARDHILSIVGELKDRIKEEIEIDSRVHSRLIGQRGRAIRKLMEEFGVDIKFPRTTDPNPNLVVITGTSQDAVLDAKEEITLQAEKMMEDIDDTYSRPPSQQQYQQQQQQPSHNKRGGHGGQGGGHGGQGGGAAEEEGFVVTGGPWEQGPQQTPNTASIADFPVFGLADQGPKGPPVASWGPRR